ncbi:DUF2750 domain-containing protein [Streptomyces sp. Tu10]|uniref:DUF2750 domain-containing protein n=1 Tax=Streptomyces sp. Tu10 TaxID=2838018 RepID=UPI001BDC82E4|nr:DUF2750 domain-containing protein [Streptomyces sp. Tu10]MBT1105687.1 DUF2750 domain-containing protein [Streptomyces sp. Tu10]
MSQTGSQTAAFFRDVSKSRVVWLVRDDSGSPTHLSADGTRSLPFWSTSPRAQRAAKIWGHGLRVESMPLDIWCDRVLTDAAEDGIAIGVNWSGPRLVGWSFPSKEVLNRLATAE